MTQCERYHGGLVFFDNNVHGLDGFCRAVSSTLEEYGFRVDRQSIQPGGQVRIASARMAAGMRLETHTELPRLVITLVTAGPSVVDTDTAHLVLLTMLHRIHELHPAQSVEWLDPDTVLPSGRFTAALAKVAPRRVRGGQELPDDDEARFLPVDEAEETISCRYDEMRGDPEPTMEPDAEALAEALRSTGETVDDPERAENDVRRLAAWGMTGVVVCLSGPVGLSMAAVNLMRGEDFRLNTHVLALTGFLGVATSSGAMAQVVSALPV